MAASRDLLKDENSLLVKLENKASAGQDFNQPLAVSDRWARFFSEWRRINNNLIGQSSDSNFNAALDEEIARLQKMRNAIASDKSDGGSFWKTMLDLDITTANALKI